MPEYISKKIFKECTGLHERQIQSLVLDGKIKKGERGEYSAQSVYDYWKSKIDKSKPITHSEIKMQQDKLKNERLELEIEKERGSLVSREERERDEALAARRVRDALFNIIPRTIPLLTAETDPHNVQTILNNEIRHALDGLKQYLTDDNS